MSKVPVAIRFLLINLLASISVAMVGIVYQGDADVTLGVSVLKYVLGLSVIYFPFVFVSSVVIGIPSLLLFRKMNWNGTPAKLAILGGVAGTLACFLIFAIFAETNLSIELLSISALAGGIGGIISGVLWWLFVENLETEANPNA